MFSNERFTAAANTQLQAQLAMLASLTRSAIESMAAIGQLSTNAARDNLAASAAAAQELLATPQQWFSVSAARSKQRIEKAVAYNRDLAGIFSRAQGELLKATEQQFSQVRQNVAELAEAAAESSSANPALTAFLKTRASAASKKPAATTDGTGKEAAVASEKVNSSAAPT